MKKVILLLLLTFAFTSCEAQQKKSAVLVAPDEFLQEMNDSNGQVIDVRTPKEYQSGHIENAVNIHLYDKDFEQRIDKLDKSKPVYVYCKVGGRSAEAVEIMKTKGFTTIIELKGGIDAWNAAGKPLKR
jgi:phage shock protein E